MEKRPVLYLMVGLPRSGKSTWASETIHPVVSPDAIRLALHGQRFVASAEPFVWATAKLMVAALFEAGHSHVTLDACNTTRKRRDEWKDPRWRRVMHIIDTSPDVCIERARSSGREDIIPVIDRMAAEYEEPGEDEVDL